MREPSTVKKEGSVSGNATRRSQPSCLFKWHSKREYVNREIQHALPVAKSGRCGSGFFAAPILISLFAICFLFTGSWRVAVLRPSASDVCWLTAFLFGPRLHGVSLGPSSGLSPPEIPLQCFPEIRRQVALQRISGKHC